MLHCYLFEWCLRNVIIIKNLGKGCLLGELAAVRLVHKYARFYNENNVGIVTKIDNYSLYSSAINMKIKQNWNECSRDLTKILSLKLIKLNIIYYVH